MRGLCLSRHFKAGLLLLIFLCTMLDPTVVYADAAVPPVWDIVADNFEGGNLDAWKKVSEDDLSLAPGGGHNGSTGLSVTIGRNESYLYQTQVARAKEGYLTFWFHPNSVSIPDNGTTGVVGRSLRIANVKGAELWHALVALRVHRPAGQGYKAYLEWWAEDGTHFDYESGEFDLVNGWQKITLGFRVDEWVAVWLNGVQVREVTGATHEEAVGEIIEIGKTNTNSSITPAGTLRYDEVAFQIPRVDDLWVDAADGSDGYDGLTPTTAFQTIQKAADVAGPGTTVHILPGVYRETVWPAVSGSAAEAVLYTAEDGPGTAILRGSDPVDTWVQLTANSIGLPASVDPSNIYYADLSAWGLEEQPRFVAEVDDDEQIVTRLALAREPDWHVTTDWKHHEFWWAADGGSGVAGCDPATDPDPDCDLSSRSTTRLIDRTNDVEPAGVEPGNLTTLGNLTGATLVAMDTKQGHYVYRRTIVGHDIAAGRVTVDRLCEHDTGSNDPGLGWGSKYYVEGKPYLLDTPGEWWYDTANGRLYLWPRIAGNPATMGIEVSRRRNGFDLTGRSYTVLNSLVIELLEGNAVIQVNGHAERSYNNTVQNVALRYANYGLRLAHDVRSGAPVENVTRGFTLANSEIAYIDTQAIRLTDWWENDASPESFTHSGVSGTIIRDNEMHHLGFRSDSDNLIGASLQFANQLRFEGNHVHHVAHSGVQFLRSVIQAPPGKEYGFTPDEIKIGGILIQDNVFERACQLTTDCGALKIWGDPPDTHVFRDVLITGNVFRDTFGWTYVSEKRGRWTGGTGSDIRGMGGYGLYIDMASGIHVYRNVAYNNANAGFVMAGVWRDGDIVLYNNVAANSLYGLKFSGASFDTHGSVNTQVGNNIVVNNEGYGIRQADADGVYENIVFDHNLYHNNGWRSYEDGGLWKPGAMTIQRGASVPNEYYQTLADIRAHTTWETHGVAGNPGFWDYEMDDHDLNDGSWPDFHLTTVTTNAVDRGTEDLPNSLATLLTAFGVQDPRWGPAFDIGRYERGFVLRATPTIQAIWPGDSTRYSVALHPADIPYTVTLTTASSSPHVAAALTPTSIAFEMAAILTVTDSHTGTAQIPGLWYLVPITGTGDGVHTDHPRGTDGWRYACLPANSSALAVFHHSRRATFTA